NRMGYNFTQTEPIGTGIYDENILEVDPIPTTNNPFGIDAPNFNNYDPLLANAPNVEIPNFNYSSENIPEENNSGQPGGKNNKGNKNRGHRFSGMFDYLPEMIAAGLTMKDSPIYTAKMQPKYNTAEVMNVQPALNRSFSQGQPYLTGTTGNAAIDNARAIQV